MSQTEENKSNEEQKEQTGENKSNEEQEEEKEVKEEEILDSQTNKNIETEHEKENNENIDINENKEINENNNKINESIEKNIPSENNNIPTENSNNNNYDYEKNKKEIMEKIELRKYQADVVEKYINETGIGSAFQIIFSELMSKKVPVDNYYNYAASRLRQIGREKALIDKKNEKNKNK